MDLRLTEEERLVRDMVRDWASSTLAPQAQRLSEEEVFPTALMKEMAELGLLTMLVPEEHGGSGVGSVAYVLAMMEIAGACASTAVAFAVTNMVAETIVREGNDEQIARYIPKIHSGEYVAAAFSLSEPGCGSDAAALTTTAVVDGDDYVLNGTKIWVTSGAHAGVTIVMARTTKGAKAEGISAFLVETDNPGYLVTGKEDKMGLRASETCVITLEDCRVPRSALLGKEGDGFRIAMRSLDSGRIGIAAQATGIGLAAHRAAVRYAQERRQFSSPIAKFQAIQWKLADMETELRASEYMVLRAAWKKQHGTESFGRQAAMAKVFATEAGFRACEEAVQIHGGYGYTREFPVERYLRDVRVCRIYEGTSEVQRVVIARSLLTETR